MEPTLGVSSMSSSSAQYEMDSSSVILRATETTFCSSLLEARKF